MVSICVLTYNHEKFIAKSLNCLLAQKVNFDYEIIIGEDNSTDNTRLICEEYAYKYKDKIKLIPKEKNLGIQNNLKRTLLKCNKKYVALCEGDDYWTNPFKLQKQIDFLESNDEYSLCSTRYDCSDYEKNKSSSDGLDDFFHENDHGISFNKYTFLNLWLTKTLTLVFRNKSFDIDLINQYQYFRDMHLVFHVLENGDGYCMNFKSGIYNIHSNGIWGNKKLIEQLKSNDKVYSELVKKNKEVPLFMKEYLKNNLNMIDISIHESKMPFLNLFIQQLCFRYLIKSKKTNTFLLKQKFMIKSTFNFFKCLR